MLLNSIIKFEFAQHFDYTWASCINGYHIYWWAWFSTDQSTLFFHTAVLHVDNFHLSYYLLQKCIYTYVLPIDLHYSCNFPWFMYTLYTITGQNYKLLEALMHCSILGEEAHTDWYLLSANFNLEVVIVNMTTISAGEALMEATWIYCKILFTRSFVLGRIYYWYWFITPRSKSREENSAPINDFLVAFSADNFVWIPNHVRNH